MTTIALRRCAHCGIINREVRLFERYFGGHGYRTVLECTNVTACWQRLDQRLAVALHPLPLLPEESLHRSYRCVTALPGL